MSDNVAFATFETTLPSRGRYYGDRLLGGVVKMRVITVKEEKILAGAKNRMSAADRILERCLVECPIPIKDMLLTDKFYLLLYLRSISYGTEYSFQIQCPACGTKYQHTVELVKGLQLRMASDEDGEPFDVKLESGKVLSLRFLRSSDEEEILRYVEQINRKQQKNVEDEDPSYEYRLSKHISAIDGKALNALEALAFVETLTGKDSLIIRRAIAQQESGVSMGISARCPACTYTHDTVLPMTSDFFPAGAA